MLPFRQQYGQTLEWVQPKGGQRRFELRAGDQLFAELVFPKWTGTLANLTTADSAWTFKRVGFFKMRVTARRPGEEADLAVFEPNWSGSEGTIRLAGGPVYIWKTANFWATQYVILDADKEPVVTYRQGVEDARVADWFKMQTRVEIPPRAANLTELPLLVALGWYLMVLHHEDTTAAAAAS